MKKYTEMVVAVTVVMVGIIQVMPLAAAQENPWACWARLRTCHRYTRTAEEFGRTCCPLVVQQMIAIDTECFCLVKPRLLQEPAFATEISNLLSFCGAPSFNTICPDSAASPGGTPSAPPPSSTSSPGATPSAPPPGSTSSPNQTPSASPTSSSTPSNDVTPSAPPPGSNSSPTGNPPSATPSEEAPSLAPPPTMTPPAGEAPSVSSPPTMTPPAGEAPGVGSPPTMTPPAGEAPGVASPPTMTPPPGETPGDSPPTMTPPAGEVPSGNSPPITTPPTDADTNSNDAEAQQNAANKMTMAGPLSSIFVLVAYILFN